MTLPCCEASLPGNTTRNSLRYLDSSGDLRLQATACWAYRTEGCVLNSRLVKPARPARCRCQRGCLALPRHTASGATNHQSYTRPARARRPAANKFSAGILKLWPRLRKTSYFDLLPQVARWCTSVCMQVHCLDGRPDASPYCLSKAKTRGAVGPTTIKVQSACPPSTPPTRRRQTDKEDEQVRRRGTQRPA